MTIGWIKLHRSLFDCEALNSREPYSKREAWVYMLMTANFESKKWLCGNELIDVERGSFITSTRKLQEKLGWGRKRLEGFLKVLQVDAMVTVKSTQQYTQIFITNYNSYQSSGTNEGHTEVHTKGAPRDTQPTHQGTHGGTTTKECKELKEGKECKEDKKQSASAGHKLSSSSLDDYLSTVPPELLPVDCIQSIRDWVDHRCEKGNAITKRALGMLLSEYQGRGMELKAAISNSIRNGYTGVFAARKINGAATLEDRKQSAVDLITKLREQEANEQK